MRSTRDLFDFPKAPKVVIEGVVDRSVMNLHGREMTGGTRSDGTGKNPAQGRVLSNRFVS